MRTLSRALTLASSLLLVIDTLACARARGPEPALALTPCRIDGLAEEIKCATVSVPEDRSRAAGRRLSIHVAVVPALARVPEPDPLVLLAGGPGQAASSYGPWIDSVFAAVRRHRDIVLVDQRGTGKSHALECEADRSESRRAIAEREEDASRACLSTLDGDPRHYTQAARDGGSRRDPRRARVRAAEPVGRARTARGPHSSTCARIPIACARRSSTASRPGACAFRSTRRVTASARSCGCSTIARAARRVRHRLSRSCARTWPRCCSASTTPSTVTTRDPRTGAAAHARASHATSSRSALRGISVCRRAGERGAAGDRARLRRRLRSHSWPCVRRFPGWSIETMSLGMTRSVLCSEDVPRIHDDEIAAATRGTVVGDGGDRVLEGRVRTLAAGVAARRRRCAGALRRPGAPSLRRSRSGRAAVVGRAGPRHDAARPPSDCARRRPQRHAGGVRARLDRDVHRARQMRRRSMPAASTRLGRPPFVTTPAGWQRSR